MPVALVADLKARATPEEWIPEFQDSPATSQEEWVRDINAALAKGDTAAALAGLGEMAKLRGMSQIARETGLAREGFYRSLKGDGNPEFATVLKVMQALGLRLKLDGTENVKAASAGL